MQNETLNDAGYTVYLLRCNDNSLYCGQTKNLQNRMLQHNGLVRKGAKYTKYRGPLKIVYREQVKTLSEALKREAEIKKYNKDQKELLIITNIQKNKIRETTSTL